MYYSRTEKYVVLSPNICSILRLLKHLNVILYQNDIYFGHILWTLYVKSTQYGLPENILGCAVLVAHWLVPLLVRKHKIYLVN